MRFGAHLPTYRDDYGASPVHVAIAEAATAAEALGYDGGWANDPVISPAAERRGTLAGAQVIEPHVTPSPLAGAEAEASARKLTPAPAGAA